MRCEPVQFEQYEPKNTQNLGCPLCLIHKNERVLYQNRLLYLVNTKTMKGHKIRLMVALNRHSVEPSFEERTQAYFLLAEYMDRKLHSWKSVIPVTPKWFMFDNTHASIKDHWHLVASDEKSADTQEQELMAKTPKVQFPLNFWYRRNRL